MGGRVFRARAFGPASLAVVALLALTAGRAGASSVRVLLLEGPGPYRVEGPGGTRTVRAHPEGFVVDGARHRARWRLEGARLAAEGRRLRGALEVRASGAGVQLINELPLEDYVAGTVGGEMYARWEPAALRAQAVASRTYVLHQQQARRRAGGGAGYDVSADTAHQVYRGLDSETPAVRAAVRATEGQVLTWEQEPILAVFHSASGGRTASAAEVWGRPLPYLVSQPVVDEEESPDTYWRLEVSAAELSRVLAGQGLRVGGVERVVVRSRSASGRVQQIVFEGDRGRGTLSGRTLRGALGADALRSTLFELREQAGGFAFVGSGRGHGVGMSQWGARALARRGLGHPEILRSFYPGARLSKLSSLALGRGAGRDGSAPGPRETREK